MLPGCWGLDLMRQSWSQGGKSWEKNRESSGKAAGSPAGFGSISFGHIRFDARMGELQRNGSAVKLTLKAAAVLATLLKRAPELVTKEELFAHVWGGKAVGDEALTWCVQELRRALDDDARQPRFIETRHRRGYRLMVPANEAVGVIDLPAVFSAAATEPSNLVGRTAEMAELQRRFGLALSGQRQLIFVTGEPGIGKSMLASAFTERVDRDHVKVTQGQCLDHHGAGEPYLPLIEALTRLAAASDGARIKTALAIHAPSWLAQMPSLWSRSDRRALETRGRATRERMLRELTHAVEAISSDSPLVLKLEDIHWSDASTLDWLVHVARRHEPARLMVLATFRAADAGAIAAGLAGITSELAVHGRCHEISLSPLRLEAIETYLTARIGDDAPGGTAARNRDRTSETYRRQSALHGKHRQPPGAAECHNAGRDRRNPAGCSALHRASDRFTGRGRPYLIIRGERHPSRVRDRRRCGGA